MRMSIIRTFDCYSDSLGFISIINIKNSFINLYSYRMYKSSVVFQYKMEHVLDNLFIAYIKSIIKNQNDLSN